MLSVYLWHGLQENLNLSIKKLLTKGRKGMLFLNNAFTRDITEYDGEVLKEVKTVDGKIYLSNGAIIKEGVVGKFFDISTNDKYGTVFEADGPDEIGPIVGFAPVTGDSAPDYFAF